MRKDYKVLVTMLLLYKSFTVMTTAFMVAAGCAWHSDSVLVEGLDSSIGLGDDRELVAAVDELPQVVHLRPVQLDHTQAPFQITSDTLYYLSDDNEVVAVDRDQQRTLWVRQLPKTPSGKLLVTAELILYSAFDGSLNALEINSGETRWCCYTDDAFLTQPVTGAAEGLFSSLTERVYRIDLDTGALLSVADLSHRPDED